MSSRFDQCKKLKAAGFPQGTSLRWWHHHGDPEGTATVTSDSTDITARKYHIADYPNSDEILEAIKARWPKCKLTWGPNQLLVHDIVDKQIEQMSANPAGQFVVQKLESHRADLHGRATLKCQFTYQAAYSIDPVELNVYLEDFHEALIIMYPWIEETVREMDIKEFLVVDETAD